MENRDLYLTGAIRVQTGISPTMDCEPKVGLVTFTFPDSPDVVRVAQQYGRGILLVNARAFADAVKLTRAEMLTFRSNALYSTLNTEVSYE